MENMKENNSDYPDLSGEQIKKIVNLAKIISGFIIFGITVVASVAIFFSYSSIKDIKEEVKTSTSELKSDVNRLLEYSQNEINRINQYSEKQINYIKDDAIYQAQKSAQKEVELYFKNDIVVKSLLHNTAQEVLSSFEKEVSDLTQALPDILLALDKIRNGNKTGLDRIVYLKQSSQNSLIKEIATKIFKEKKDDYHELYNNVTGIVWSGDIKKFLEKMENDPSSYLAFASLKNDGSQRLSQAASSELWSNKNKSALVEQLIHNVNSSVDLNLIALSFFVVKEITNINCELFDFVSFKKNAKSYIIKKQYLD